ncbi:MAG: Ig-like domain-containing protein, partial [Flavobacteriaceae bacterium]|nr:Ig-like domain-containing protein [Flavobacteriaceae bacterium]
MKLKTTLLLMALIGFSNVQAQCFVEQNGIVAVEAESKTASGWNIETSATPYSGSGYIAWRGPNYFDSPGNGVITYSITINNPGTYRFIWRSKVGIIDTSHPNPSSEHNDSWLKIEGSDFFAQSGSSIKYPIGSGKTPEVFGSGSDGWFKVFLSGTTNWTWNTLTSDNNGHFIYATFNSPGTYNVKISGRSNGHFIDRFVMYKESLYSINQAISASACGTPPPPDGGGEDPPPPPPPPSGENNPPTVSITNPANGANFDTGSNVAVTLNSSDPDGDITKH